MIGIIYGILSSFFDELFNSLLKLKQKKYTIIELTILRALFSFLFIFSILLYKKGLDKGNLTFNKDSILIVIIRCFFEIGVFYYTTKAVEKCDRTTFAVFRLLTLPGLIIVDILLGFSTNIYLISGILIIISSFIIFNFLQKTLNFKGWKYALKSSILRIITLTLFKASINNYGNSIEINESITFFVVTTFFIVYDLIKNKNNFLIKIIKDKILMILGVIYGASFYFCMYSARLINLSDSTAIRRAGTIIFGLLFGILLFKETNIIKKIIFIITLLIGIYFITLGK